MATCLFAGRSAQLITRLRKPAVVSARAVISELQRPMPVQPTLPAAQLRGSEQLVLGIESSCDDTGVALLRSADGAILGETVVGQTEVHAQWGGVVPTLAMEAHKRAIDKAVIDVLQQAGLPLDRITACAATVGPGLSMCLQVGARKAMALAQQQGIPFVPVHHMEAHALTVRQGKVVEFPYLCLLVSGGHSMLLVVHGVGDYTLLGTSLDDSVGEAFDKTARMLGLPLEPSGGAAVEAFAREGDPHACKFAVPLARREDCNFSYAGVKTAVLLAVQRIPQDLDAAATEQAKRDIAASFQRVAVQHLTDKTARAARWAMAAHPSITTLVVSGGVACNQLVKQRLGNLASITGLELVAPPPRLCTDNGVMVAWAGIERLRLGLSEIITPDQDLERVPVWPRWPLTNRIDERLLPEKRSAKKRSIHTSLTELTMDQLAAAQSAVAAVQACA